jgi:hypothetical protein
VIVASKFDNRLKEFAERWEVDKYLSATGYLPANVKPFFIALPKVTTRVVNDSRHVSTQARLHVLAKHFVFSAWQPGQGRLAAAIT